MSKNISILLIFVFIASCLSAGENIDSREEKLLKEPPVNKEKTEPETESAEPEEEEKIETEKADLKEKFKAQIKEAAPKTEANIIIAIKEIFQIIEKNYPALIKDLENDEIQREEILSDFAKSFDAGVKLIKTREDQDEKESSAEKIEKKNYFPIVNISSNKISYFRIDEFDGKVFELFKNDCEMVASLAKPPVGIIIDLRNCSGQNYEDALKCLRLLCKGKSLPEVPGKEKIKRSFNLPIAVLIGENTRAAAEVFVYWIAKAKQGLTIGEDSAERPFPEKKFELKTEKYTLLIPEIPDYLSCMVVEDSNPSINVPAYPQIAYKRISEESKSEKSDKCLLRAVDLLISLNALEKQWKK
jgi:hypothetical protein